MSITGTECGNTGNTFIWLVNEPKLSNRKDGSKNLIRANAAAWGHQSRRRNKQHPSVRKVKGGRLAPRVQVKVSDSIYTSCILEVAYSAMSSSKRKMSTKRTTAQWSRHHCREAHPCYKMSSSVDSLITSSCDSMP